MRLQSHGGTARGSVYRRHRDPPSARVRILAGCLRPVKQALGYLSAGRRAFGLGASENSSRLDPGAHRGVSGAFRRHFPAPTRILPETSIPARNTSACRVFPTFAHSANASSASDTILSAQSGATGLETS